MDMQTIIDTLRNRARKLTALSSPTDADAIDTATDVVGGFVPGLGTALAARDFERARRDDDRVGMALAGASMVPVVGGLARAASKTSKAQATVDALRGKSLYHGGRLVEAPIADKQGVVIDNVPGVSFTPNIVEASRYAMHNRGHLYRIDPSDLRIYRAGQDNALDSAVHRGDHKAVRDAGFDGFDFSSIYPQSREVVLYDPTRTAREAAEIAKLHVGWDGNVVKQFKRTEAGQKRVMRDE